LAASPLPRQTESPVPISSIGRISSSAKSKRRAPAEDLLDRGLQLQPHDARALRGSRPSSTQPSSDRAVPRRLPRHGGVERRRFEVPAVTSSFPDAAPWSAGRDERSFVNPTPVAAACSSVPVRLPRWMNAGTAHRDVFEAAGDRHRPRLIPRINSR
jgi:hypothetical protein